MANFAYIQITRECDQECRFCSNPPSGWKDMSLASAKKLVDTYQKKGYDGLILTGGEPTKYPHLRDLIRYCSKKKIETKMITNAQKTADKKYLRSLAKAGLRHVHVSIYSHRPKIQAFLSKKEDSLENIKKTLGHLSGMKEVRVDINITFNKYNADHLSSLVEFIIRNYPFVGHFSCNNLDPTSERARENTDTIPKFSDFEIELVRMAKILEKNKKTFRIERVPLCYMPGFEHVSTETRKIVKNELRPLYFLDGRGLVVQENFYRDKPKKCEACFLDEICAGLCAMDEYYSSKELSPVFVQKEIIKKKIIEDEDVR
ncbi:MAG: radical SAM protein [Candidatus Moranbacteria bacterium]|nr:radical SAM protein [Candidatus Moranbacteria bacterium]